MDLRIFWTDFAKAELYRIYLYLKENASTSIAKNETKKISRATNQLQKQPEMGQIEELLRDRDCEFRYLTHQNYEIIYWVHWKKNRVEVVDVFHTSQHPEKIKRTKSLN